MLIPKGPLTDTHLLSVVLGTIARPYKGNSAAWRAKTRILQLKGEEPRKN